MDPKICLGIDNCFASKRWVRPAEWARVIRDLGLRCVEASADTECDPLYMGGAFTRDWIRDVKVQCERFGVEVKNVYSGHGTYATCGLAHYDARVARRMRDRWMKAQIDTARALGAGFGFFAHGFEALLLQDDALYERKLGELYRTLSDIALCARTAGVACVGLEQMYSPHQPPWRIRDAELLLRRVLAIGGAPLYITLDLGHMNGQRYFRRPGAEDIRAAIGQARQGDPPRRVWLGSDRAHELYRRAASGETDESAAVEAICADVQAHPHLFSEPEDWNIGAWVSRLGCYSPIMHLQQSDGRSSPHWTFTREHNARGVVKPDEVFAALRRAYAQPEDPAMPPRCGEIVMTLEPFLGTADSPHDLLGDIAESAA